MSTSRPQARVTRFFELLPLAAGVFVALIAAGTLGEWNAGFDPVDEFFPGGVAMVPLTSVLFLLAGGSLALQAAIAAVVGDGRSRWLRWTAVALAAAAGVVALIELLAWAYSRNLGLDLMLFPTAMLQSPWEPPGRPGINTVVAFVLASAGLFVVHLDRRTYGRVEQWLGLGTGLLGFLAVIGYAFGIASFYSTGRYNGMAISTAVCLCVLGGGIILSRRREGLPWLLADAGAAGTVARRLVPAAVLVPFLLGWARLFGERWGWYDTAFGVSFYVLANIAILLWLVSWAAKLAMQGDLVREQILAREQAGREAAEGANIAKGNFLAVMSHELRTPLSAIIGYEELLADGITGPVTDAQRHQLARIKASAQHLLQLIDQILTYSRIDAGREVLRLDDVDANELASDAASLVEPLASDKGLALEITLLGYHLPMSTDAGKVRQIIVNLLSNAVKFTSSGTVQMKLYHDGATVRYVVSDTGVGIAQENLDHIFEAFWQVEQSSTRRTGGTGLGLSVTRRLANLLGGDISVESDLGSGSTFTVTLPLELSASGHARRSAATGVGVG